MGPPFFPYAVFDCRVARRPRLRGTGAGAIGSGAGASSRNAGAGSSSKGATRSDRGELAADRGELAAALGSSSARNPAHGCCQVNRSQSAATITQAMNMPMKRAADSIAGAQSDLSAALKVVIVLGGRVTIRGRSGSSPGGGE